METTSRRDFVKGITAVALGGPLMSACATSSRNIELGSVNQNATSRKNVEFGSINQDIAPYDGERTTIRGIEFYVERSGGALGALPYTFFIFEDSIRLSDLSRGETDLDFAQGYIPQLITNNGISEVVELKTGVRARITSNGELRAREDLNRQDYNFSARTSERDALWTLPTVDLFGERFLYTHVPNRNLSDRGKLPFMLIPEKEAEVGVSNLDGSVILLSDRIYRPVTEVASYTGRDLFQSDAALPNWSYYRRTPGGWFRESPDNDVIHLTNSQTGEVLRAIRKQNNSR